MKWCFSVSDLQKVWTNSKRAMKKSWRNYCQTAQICYIGKFWGFYKVGKNGLKNTALSVRSVRPCSFHHEVYKSLFVLGWMWHRCVVRHKWFARIHILSLQTGLYRSAGWKKTLAPAHGDSELRSMSANPEEVSLGSSTGKRWICSGVGAPSTFRLTWNYDVQLCQ